MFDIRKIQEKALYDAVKAESDADTAHEVVYGNEQPANAENNADWVNSAMRRLENQFEYNTVKKVRMNCQCGYGMDKKLTLVKELMSCAASLEELGSLEKAKAAGLFCRDGELFLQFDFCPCPMLAEVDKLEKNTWCQCTAGYSKALFEKAFACNVDVELQKSIKAGDDKCLMKIILHNPIWK